MPENIIKVNEKLENPVLRGLMEKRGSYPPEVQIATDNEEFNDLMNQIADEFVNRAPVIVPVKLSKEPVADESGSLTVAKNSTVSFVLLSSGEQHFLPVFTDSEEFSKWKGDEVPVTLQMDFDHCASVLEANGSCAGVVINPFSDNLLITRPLILRWHEHKQIAAHGHASHVINEHTPVEVYVPKPYPMEMSNKLCETAKGNPAVNAIWLRGITLNGERGYLLVVDFEGDRNSVFSAFGDCAKPFLGAMALNIVALSDGFGGKATENVLPIYTKE